MNTAALSETRAESLNVALFNHLVLPPQLPQQEDNSIEEISQLLNRRAQRAASFLLDVQHYTVSGSNSASEFETPQESTDIDEAKGYFRVWEDISFSLQLSREVTILGRVDKKLLRDAFQTILTCRLDAFILLHVAQQNAGILIHRATRFFRPSNKLLERHDQLKTVEQHDIIFEFFEASARCEDVLAAENALEWDFPGTTVAVPVSEFEKEDLQIHLTSFIEQASLESISQFAARTFKAGQVLHETRDTTNPSLISSLLAALLEVNGRRLDPPRLRKRIHDTVTWNHGQKPWRRLPYWLVLRVGLERFLTSRLPERCGLLHYKFFTAVLLAQYVDEILPFPAPTDVEKAAFVKNKLSRKLLKLDIKYNGLDELTRKLLFKSVVPWAEKHLQKATDWISSVWDEHRDQMKKKILSLPRRAVDLETTLTLEHSRFHLQNIIASFHQSMSQGTTNDLDNDFNPRLVAEDHVATFLKPFVVLRQREMAEQVSRLFQSAPDSEDTEVLISSIAKWLYSYVADSLALYADDPELKSAMLLTVMDVWHRMDQACCNKWPLLKEYHPGFSPDILHVLCAVSRDDLSRLRQVQDYLARRFKGCSGIPSKFTTIFHDPERGCFADRFYDESHIASECAELRQRIEDAGDMKETSKWKEWQTKSQQYEELTRAVSEGTCVYLVDDDHPLQRGKHHPDCARCSKEEKASRIRIQVCEWPLPEYDIMAKAAIVELLLPPALAAYRDVTYFIIHKLGRPRREASVKPMVSIFGYSELASFAERRAHNPPSLTLASSTKSHLMTHYATKRFPVEFDTVRPPNGLKYGYYDSRSGTWTGRGWTKPTFNHHFKFDIPQQSPLVPFIRTLTSPPGISGRHSNDIISSQATCPSGINSQEFTAFQRLLSSGVRRWEILLKKLASSNLNFSSEAVANLISFLSLQVGPHNGDGGVIPEAHSIIRDELFCLKLIEELERRLEGIRTNWTEIHLMEAIITITLRLSTLLGLLTDEGDVASAASLDVHSQLHALRNSERDISMLWMRQLRDEAHQEDPVKSKRSQGGALWAALFCKRLLGGLDQPTDLDLEVFLEASITVRNILSGQTELPGGRLRTAITRDVRMMFLVKDRVTTMICDRPEVLLKAVNWVWPGQDGNARQIHSIAPSGGPWLHFMVADGLTFAQSCHYNCLQGLLLVQGHPIVVLPPKYRDLVALKALFGQQTIMTYRSNQPGMAYCLCIRPEGFQIHVGHQGGQPTIRAYKGQDILQLIPSTVFTSHSVWELPGPLIHECFHWLNLKTSRLEIWPKPPSASKADNIWKWRFGKWSLDLRSRRCIRPIKRTSNKLTVVDPYSSLFHRIARIFDGFESRDQILVFQNSLPRSRLQVKLPRVDLKFFVNDRLTLESRELRAQIDPVQDVGVWHGFQGKILCSNTDDLGQALTQQAPRQMILVPIGDLAVTREGCHVIVRSRPTGVFGKYDINQELGRLDCAAEPLLIYKKAQLHAFTSFVLPDALTGRTGAEESLHWLSLGICQPWSPLHDSHLGILKSIAALSPRREYYPPDLKVMQREFWNKNYTLSIQHEAFRPTVERIILKSTELLRFHSNPQPVGPLLDPEDSHLRRRAWQYRAAFHRVLPYTAPRDNSGIPTQHRSYRSRDDAQSAVKQYKNAVEIAQLVSQWPAKIDTELDLASALSGAPSIAGFAKKFDRVLLSERLQTDVAKEWGSLVLFVMEHRNDRFSLMFLLAELAFRSDAPMPLLRTLLAFATFEDLLVLQLPMQPEYLHFQPNQVPRIGYLQSMIRPFKFPAKENTVHLRQFPTARQVQRAKEEKELWEEKADAECERLARFLADQWPSRQPVVLGLSGLIHVDAVAAMETILPEWQRIYDNMQFSNHINVVQGILKEHHLPSRFVLPEFVARGGIIPQRRAGSGIPVLSDLVRRASCPRANQTPHLPQAIRFKQLLGPLEYEESLDRGTSRPLQATEWRAFINYGDSASLQTMPPVANSIAELRTVIGPLTDSPSIVRRRYAADLLESLRAFERVAASQYQHQCATHGYPLHLALKELQLAMRFVTSCLTTTHTAAKRMLLEHGQFTPVITVSSLLELLRSFERPNIKFGVGMRELITDIGVLIVANQEKRALTQMHHKKDVAGWIAEFLNRGHGNWSPLNQSDWLLLEIEANIRIRPDQVDVAMATIAPQSGSNSVLQMNMGQGKTSCIIPMVAAVLADKKNLPRVLVPHALLPQTAQILHARLGVLLGRELRHVPFSRRTIADEDAIQMYGKIHKEVRDAPGIMICVPEHNLSFKLGRLQMLLDNRLPEATLMVRTQNALDLSCRDILDESDHTLAVRTQLIYPSGSQLTVDGAPGRWQTAQAVLRLVEAHLDGISRRFRQSIKVVRSHGSGFPFVFFLRHDAEEELLNQVVLDLCKGREEVLPVRDMEKIELAAVRKFISQQGVTRATNDRVRKLCPDRPSTRETVHLLRGLIVNRILLMSLKKRWNVQYGLHPLRDPMAVPFHAKGVPSERSEWGHPDSAILLTCLAFYYEGINPKQLKESLEHILKADDPSAEYDRWTQSTRNLPGALKDWNSINVDDEVTLSDIWQAVRYNVVVIDYYLNNFVFPRYAKQFKFKLQSSGWDIPSFTPGSDMPGAAATRPLTTGFSGTNDNRTMLPLTIKQQDLAKLVHTNAEVLTYLLAPRCRDYVVTVDADGKRLSEVDMLRQIKTLKIQVLIDTGAQFLEMDNFTLAKKWLEIDPEHNAALYFDETTNRPWIQPKQGMKVPLTASTYADDLAGVLIYLDEAHTRGTDLKLPPKAHGALTLGMGQTKDHTVQGAMRLRQLKTTQRITFFAPPEVHQSILDLRGKTERDKLDSYDVICWLIDNTCDGIEQLQPLYYAQGMDYCRRIHALHRNPKFIFDEHSRKDFVNTIRQEEQQTLQQMYEPMRKGKEKALSEPIDPQIRGFIKELDQRRKAFQDNGKAVHASALQEVEMEREIALEVESVRQVKRQKAFAAVGPQGLHKDLHAFITTGRLPPYSQVITHVFEAMSKTGLGRKYAVNGFFRSDPQSRLFVSAEFQRTVKLQLGETNDSYLRDAEVVLWSEISQTAILISPEEHDSIRAILWEERLEKYPRPAYLLMYSPPVTRSMLRLNDLKYYTMPRLPDEWKAPEWLTLELGIFAGRLYFEWEEYEGVCRILGVNANAWTLEEEDDLSLEETVDAQTHEDERDASSSYAAAHVDRASESKQATTGGEVSPIITHLPRPASTRLKSFTRKPLSFMSEWLALRRKGADFMHTPMGLISQGKPLHADYSFFRKATGLLGPKPLIPTVCEATFFLEDDEDSDGDLEELGDLITDNATDDIQYASDEK